MSGTRPAFIYGHREQRAYLCVGVAAAETGQVGCDELGEGFQDGQAQPAHTLGLTGRCLQGTHTPAQGTSWNAFDHHQVMFATVD